MSDAIQVTADHAVPVEVLESSSVTVTVLAGDTVFFADNPQVSADTNQGSLTAGQSATFSHDHWLRSVSLSQVSVDRVDVGVPFGAARLGPNGLVGESGGSPLAGSVPVARATDGSFGLTAPTGSGFEAVFVGGGLDRLTMNGVEL